MARRGMLIFFGSQLSAVGVQLSVTTAAAWRGLSARLSVSAAAPPATAASSVRLAGQNNPIAFAQRSRAGRDDAVAFRHAGGNLDPVLINQTGLNRLEVCR